MQGSPGAGTEKGANAWKAEREVKMRWDVQMEEAIIMDVASWAL